MNTIQTQDPISEMSTMVLINLVAKGGMNIDDALKAATILEERIPKI